MSKLVAVNSQSIWWPYHYVVVNKQGNVLHFMHANPHEKNSFAPFWFEGSFEGIRRSKAEIMLRRSGRSVKFEAKRNWLTFVVLSLIFLCVFVPFMFVWTLYPAYFCAKWSVDAVVKRLKKPYIKSVRRVVDQDG